MRLNGEKATILVVEDDKSLMQGIRDILELQGYTVLTAGSGVEGLEVIKAREIPPDLIISDIMMPHMNGYDFLRAVREELKWTSIPFVFLTAKGEKADVRAGKMLGVDDYMVKPFEAEDLVVVVASKLRRHRELEHVHTSNVSSVKRNILTILNHEFRTPLTYIVAYSDMLNRDADDLSYTEMRSFLKGINAGADRLRRLIENFILLVDLETGEAETNFKWRKRELYNYDAILDQAVSISQSFADERGVRIEIAPIPQDLPPVFGDEEYVKAAVIRLLDNAIKFSYKPESVVTVSLRREEDYIVFSIQDQGRGIPEPELATIFEIFYQIDRQTYEDQGAGAGLPIVQRVVQMHGGKVDVKSKQDQGSCFSMYLPISKIENV